MAERGEQTAGTGAGIVTGDRMDVQIAEWQARNTGGDMDDILDALIAERKRADLASEQCALSVKGLTLLLEGERDRADKAEALAEKRAKDYHVGNRLLYDHYARKEHRLHDEVSGRDHLISTLWKSRRKWQERHDTMRDHSALAMHFHADTEAKLTAVRNLHATVDARWSSEGPDVKRCRHCGQLAPCDTALVVGE